MRVYNLVGATHGVNNLAMRRLKVSRFSRLNDPFELLAADLLDKRDKSALEKMKDQLDKKVQLFASVKTGITQCYGVIMRIVILV
jgi:hypothetical protein